MVFSQTSHKTQTVLKVVNLDRLKNEKNHQVIGSTGAVTCIDGYSNTAESSPMATTSSYTEVSLKTEPLYDSAMFHESDFEFFQELDPLSFVPAKEEVVQTIDSYKKTEETAHSIDTQHIPISPQGWEQFDANSPLPQAGFYNITPILPLSPSEKFGHYDNSMLNFPEDNKGIQGQGKFLDISNLPLVFGDLSSEQATDVLPWQTTAEPVEWTNTTNTHYDLIYTNTHNSTPFINAEDSLDLKFESVMPGEVEVIDLVDPQYVEKKKHDFGPMHNLSLPKRRGLSVDVSARAPTWPGDISTPVILNEVMSLEKENSTKTLEPPESWHVQDLTTDTFTTLQPSPVEYEPITPKSESHIESDYDDIKSSTSKRRRHDSEDSDETYTPHTEQPPRKYKRRKPQVPLEDLMQELERQPKARRGRPPKRRESTVSSACSVDDNSVTVEYKYRELRDKNNEASKRSRMNRKFKEKEMERLADELEKKNKRLRVEADVLEELTKKLKNELMSAILNK